MRNFGATGHLRPLRDGPLIFLHHARTTGNSIIAALQEELGLKNVSKLGVLTPEQTFSYDDFIAAARADSYPCYVGHFCYEGHRHVPRPCVYVTCLRDPVERVVSRYRAWGNKKGTPEEVLGWIGSEFESSNGMVKRLCGVGMIGDDEHRPYDAFTDQFVSERMDIGPEHLDRAMETIESHFVCVMIQEFFAESLVLLQNTLSTGPLFSFQRKHTNRAITPLRTEDLPPNIIDHIEAANRYDRRFYEHCKARFVRCVAAEGEAFRDDLRLLTLIIEALGHSHFPSQPTVEEVARNLNGFIDDLCRNDRAADAVKVLRGITAKPDMGGGILPRHPECAGHNRQPARPGGRGARLSGTVRRG